jgi:hypothetical protein
MGLADRIIRVVLAVVIVILYVKDIITGTLGIILLILALVFVLTSLLNVCPLYKVFGISTSKAKKAE